MEPLYLVDGSGYIFRAFYAVSPLSNSKGLPTNAVFGFTRMLVKLLRDLNAKYIAVCFDTGQPTFRHQLYPAYKANRKECPAELVPQMPYFRRVVQALGVPCLEKVGFEADDIIGTLARQVSAQGTAVVIVSGDKDLTQLVSHNVQMWDAMRDVHFDEQMVREKFGVTPEQIVDYLALTGDSSDNVPGVKGIGPKSAQILLNHFGTIENLLQGLSKIEEISGLRGAEGLKIKLESGVESIRLSKQLVTLDTQVEPYNQLKVEEFVWTDINPDQAATLFEELEFSNIIPSLPAKKSVVAANQNYTTVSPVTFDSFLEALSRVKEFAFDTETTSLDPLSCELVGISFSWEKGVAYYLPFQGKGDAQRLLDPAAVREKLAPIFADSQIRKCGANLKFDMRVLENQGYRLRGLSFDVMLASYVLNPDKRQHGLKSLAQSQLDISMTSFEDLVGKETSIADIDTERTSAYACLDADASWQLSRKFDGMLGELTSVSPRRVFSELEMPLVAVLATMEQRGVGLDVEYLRELSREFGTELAALEKRIYQLAGQEVNLNSPKQLSEVLFERLQIPVRGVKKTQTSYSTDASVLRKLAPEYPIVREIIEYRELFKLQSTYVDALVRLRHPKTGRIHTSFNQAVAATGRLSSSNPNLQNIPIRNPRGRRIRNAFIAAPGYLLLAADYSQIELRVLAELSGDKNLRQAFLAGEDIHSVTAGQLFGAIGLSAEEKDRLRRIAKTINFGIIYGMSAFRLADELRIPRRQAQEYIDQYFDRYPKVREYFEALTTQAKARGYVETYFGRRRHLRDIDTAGRDEGYLMRSLANAPLQGTAADIIKIAMIRLDHAIQCFAGQCALVLQVHDELVLEVAKSLVDEVKKVVVDTMESAVEFHIPLRVDVSLGRTWGEVE